MKFFLLALLLPLSASALEVRDVQLVRMLNGQNIQCKETYELNKPSYFPELASASANDQAVSLSLKIKFQICAGDLNERHWADRRPLDPIFTKDVDGNPVRVEWRDPEFLFGSTVGDEGLIVPAGNEVESTLSFQFPLIGISPEDRASLNAGNPVRVRTQLIYRAVGTAFTNRGSYGLGYQFSAAYTVFFTLKK
ncbi:MAG: hypothetical protein ACXVB9_16095 [Bdellovibrionota bacterium]